ncbi:pirin family protein [Leucobacter rhizosphaerae]|uniref:Pirin family protein n=1 Tax=Leucobacter rhizosphaerae TaxID=2932245 RepID=A0ABY4FZA9_9MICO|nr:pirin family protein [Leucobacter rhizosphaerae]UOQ61424.1 pirin family protein [Leucobacter rhizosphaerae]
MSNPESHPAETVCAAGPARVEILEPRDVPLGGLRAMNVRRTLPQRERSLIGAWCFLDHYGPDRVADSGGMNVPAHPHTGLQTVSWLFSGEIEHRDSAGFQAIVRPGELNLMTAGRGISHSERSTPDTTVLHGAQLWVALPHGARDTPKTFEHYAPPVVAGEGWRAQVFLGTLLGETSPMTTHTALVGAEIALDPGCSIRVEVAAGHEHGVLVDAGAVTVRGCGGDGRSGDGRGGDGRGAGAAVTAGTVTAGTVTAGTDGAGTDGAGTVKVGTNALAYVPAGSSELHITAGANGARVLLIGGEPFGEELVMWWNFVGRDHDEIMRARADWQAELAAAGVADVAETPGRREAPDAPVATNVSLDAPAPDRFGLPDGEPEPPLSAPPAPIAQLLPRRR